MELAGRDDELRQIVTSPCHTVIAGEAGIGKSMLLDAASASLRDDGWIVLHARADALEQRIPYSVLGQIGIGVPTDGSSSFGAVCGTLVDHLRALLDASPVALAIDDVDGLDEDTLAALVLASRRLEFVVLATSRTEPVVDELHPVYVRLAPLDEQTIASIAAQVIGSEPDADFMQALHRRTDGNPFFAVEIATSLRDSGLIDESGPRGARLTGPLRLTRRDAILRRLGPPSPVLDAVAVLGRAEPGDVELVAAMTGVDATKVAVAFDDFVDRRILDESYTFTHDLVREAVYEAIGPARQRLLHKAIAERLRGTSADLMALAHHVSLSAMPGDTEAAAVLAQAADRARGVAPATAASLYARSLELVPGDPSVMARHSRALSMASRPAEAAVQGRAALAALPRGPERARAANVVISALVELGQLDDAVAVADTEVDMHRDAPVLVAQRAGVLWNLRRFDEALAAARRADELPCESAAERVMTLGPLGIVASYTAVPRTVPEIAAEMLELGARLPRTLELYSTAIASYALATCAFVSKAREPLSRAEVLLEEVGGTAFRANILVARAMVDWLEGRWDDAIDAIESSHAEMQGAQLAVQASALDAIEIEIRSWRGQQNVARLTETLAPVPNLADLRTWAVAGALMNVGRIDDARSLLEVARTRDPNEIAYRPIILARRVEIDPTEDLLRELEADAQIRDNPWCVALLLRSRALVHKDAALARQSAEVAREEGLPFEVARSQLTEAELSNEPVLALEDAYRTFQSLGADSLRRRAGALLKAKGMKVPRQRATSSGVLSDTEAKIAKLVQQGLRNREIAAALRYSPRTVDVYLSRIYAKLGITSRLELARALDMSERLGT